MSTPRVLPDSAPALGSSLFRVGLVCPLPNCQPIALYLQVASALCATLQGGGIRSNISPQCRGVLLLTAHKKIREVGDDLLAQQPQSRCTDLPSSIHHLPVAA
jgi:hypothetical protein